MSGGKRNNYRNVYMWLSGIKFFYSLISRLALEPTLPPIWYVLGTPSLWVKPGYGWDVKTYHTPLSSINTENKCSYQYTCNPHKKQIHYHLHFPYKAQTNCYPLSDNFYHHMRGIQKLFITFGYYKHLSVNW
jgi:hypothetical protein